jgi:tetratricopeptide (TPR) repeat protein
MPELPVALQPFPLKLDAPTRLPAIPWRDPHSVPPEKLAQYLQTLEQLCVENPASADLYTCLGMAHAMNYDVYRSEDALERAIELDPTHFFAQLKFAELLYRLRTLHRAETETIKALELAGNAWELSLARNQLKEIRRLLRKGNERPPLLASWKRPALLCGAMATVFALSYFLR